jgi:uncharacterized iron-regulated membrane protein
LKLDFTFIIRRITLRRLVFWVHLPLGVAAAAVVFLLSVTGVLLAFERQITRWVDSSLVSDGPATPGVEALLAAAATHHRSAAITRITLRSPPRAPAEIALGREVVAVDPASGHPLGGRSAAVRDTFRAITGLHRWLALPMEKRDAGRAVTGACTLLFVGLLLTGPVLWRPRGGSWTRALVPGRGLEGRARAFNRHNVAGAWAVLPLIVVAASGVVIAYPWAGELVYRLAGDTPPPRRRPAPESGARAAAADTRGLDAVLRAAQAAVPGWRSISITLPRAGGSTVAVAVDTGGGGRPDTRTQLTLDRASAQVVARESFDGYTAGRRARAWLRWLHTGEAGGLPGQALAAAAAGAAALLAWTGLSLAFRRWRAWRARTVRVPESPSPAPAGLHVTAGEP